MIFVWFGLLADCLVGVAHSENKRCAKYEMLHVVAKHKIIVEIAIITS